MKGRCALYVRVSTMEQNTDNQLEQLKRFAGLHGLKVVEVYRDVMSGGASNRPEFQRMLRDARARRFDTILVWSLDRFSREGISNTLSYLERLRRYGVSLRSLQESWLDTSDDGVGSLLIAVLSWVAEQERRRISERTKAGLRRAKSSGKRVGRPRGRKDSKPRSKAGYYRRWAK